MQVGCDCDEEVVGRGSSLGRLKSPFLVFLLQIQAKSASPANSAENSPVNSATALKNRPLSVMVTGKGTVLQKAKVTHQFGEKSIWDSQCFSLLAAEQTGGSGGSGLGGVSHLGSAPDQAHLEQARLLFL